MTKTLGSVILAAMAGLTLAACTTVVREPAPRATTTVVVPDRSPEVVVVPRDTVIVPKN